MADDRRRELREVFRTYDPAQIAAVATVEEIEFAYNAGIIGPNVADRAIALRDDPGPRPGDNTVRGV